MAELSGETLAAISNEMVRLKAQYFGKGAVEAKSYLNDNFLFCVLKGGLTKVEHTLLQANRYELVREVRLTFQNEMEEKFREAVERLTGRKVVGYQSQIIFDPDYGIEIFILEAPEKAIGTD